MNANRREFIIGAAALAGASTLPFAPAHAAVTRYRRYNVTSAEGKLMLESYASAIETMLKLPPDHPHNWFRIAFVHFMDCPHGNWWFYVWHRGYLGYFEETVRAVSGNPKFTLPYWDWTQTPEIPASMFEGVLTPVNSAYSPYTKNLDTFTNFIKPPLQAYWNTLTPAQRQQLDARGYTSFDRLWNDVTGYDPSTGKVIPGNQGFAETSRARYLTASNPKLDDKTANACSAPNVSAGLAPTLFNDKDVSKGFTSLKTPSHNYMGTPSFSLLEGQPHNLVHNYIGGVGPWGEGPFGNMTNFLSPVDPIFFLHHANMDRLWSVWEAKQREMGLAYLPTDPAELAQLSDEPFLYFVRADGTYVTDSKAGNYLSTDRFEYDYAPGFGDSEGAQVSLATPNRAATSVDGSVKAGVGLVQLAANTPAETVVASVTVPRTNDASAPRQYDLLINAPANVTHVDADSPYYGGTIGFFGPAMSGMTHDSTFVVPLQKRVPALATLRQTSNQAPATLELRLVPTHDKSAPALALKAVTLHSL